MIFFFENLIIHVVHVEVDHRLQWGEGHERGSTERGRTSTGRGGTDEEGSTSALCTGFTLVFIIT
jgi:hypothetical protein